jgi:hypothetical protein
MTHRQRITLWTWASGLRVLPLLAHCQKNWLSDLRRDACESILNDFQAKPFVFVISFHKCGTRSLHVLFEKMGYRGIHWPHFINCGIEYVEILKPHARDPKACIRLLAPLFGRYDCFSDVPFPGMYRELAEVFPNSRFILTYRPEDVWWKSISGHWHLSATTRRLDAFEAIQYGLPVGNLVTSNDRSLLVDRYAQHNIQVQRFFEGSNRLLASELTAPDLSARISKFVDHPVTYPMPKEAGFTVGTSRVDRNAEQVRRRCKT